jgi:protein gp37
MADNSAIAWTNHTFNGWIGCTKVSAGCDNCYAEADFDHRKHWVHWGNHPRRRTSVSTWQNPVRWNRKAATAGARPRVFCSSLSDVFDNQAPEEWRHDLWRLIRGTPNLDWLLLTKRPQNIQKMLPPDWDNGWPHVWLGTTTENQTEADRRIPHLRSVPAVVRFLSCEPLLEPIQPDLAGIDWLICGGESGPGARYMEPAWARSLRDQCEGAGVAFFMKQMTKKADIPEDLLVRQYPTLSLARAA